MDSSLENQIVLLPETRVAELLGVTRRCLQRWRADGSGPVYIKMGRHIRYRKEHIEKWLDKQSRHSTAEDRMIAREDSFTSDDS